MIIEIKKDDVQGDGIEVRYLQVVLMPNGELICLGKTVGWFDTVKGYVFSEVKKENV